MRKAFSVAVAVPLALAGFVFAPSQAAFAAPAPTGSPFKCAKPTNFVAQGETATQLYSEVLTSAGEKLVPVGSPWSGENGTGTQKYNAMGFNQADGYLYAIARTSGMASSDLVRIDSTGDVQNLGVITGVPNVDQFWNTGAFFDGEFYATYENSTSIYKIDLNTLAATPVAINSAWQAADFTEIGGYLWGVLDQTMYRLSPTTGAVSSFDVSAAIPDKADGQGGAAWTFDNGDFAVRSSQTGKVTQIKIGNPASDSPTFTKVGEGTGLASSRTDGASCKPSSPVTELKPIDCSTPKIFVAQGTTATTLYSKQSSSSAGSYSTLGGPWSGGTNSKKYNAIAYNQADGYIYGLADLADGGVELVKIGDGGVVAVVGAVKGVPLDSSFRNNGSFINGAYYFGSMNASKVYRLDLSTLQATAVSLSQAWEPSDFTAIGGYLWGILGSTISRLDVSTGAVAKFGTDVIGDGVYGAGGGVFTYANGNFGVVSSETKAETEISITNPGSDKPTFAVVARVDAPTAALNDATSCTASQTPVTPTTMKPIDCSTPKIFVAQGEDATVLKVKGYSEATGVNTTGTSFSALGSAWTGTKFTTRYNAIAYNNRDGYIYGLADAESGSVDLVKVGDQGVVQVIGEVKGQPFDHSFRNNGTFINGTYYFSTQNANVIYSLDLNTLVSTPITLSQTWEPSDFVQIEGYLWGILGGTMSRLDVRDGQVVKFNIGNLIGGTSYGAGGAVFRYNNADFGVISSDVSAETQIHIANPGAANPTFTLVGQTTAPTSGRNDGTSCVDSSFGDGGQSTGTAALTATVQTNERPRWMPAEAGSNTPVSFTVVNTGSVALSNITVVPSANNDGGDGNLGNAASGWYSAVSCTALSLAPGASTTCTTTYTLSSADAEQGRMYLGGVASGTANGSTVKAARVTQLIYYSV